jgi:serine/threonine protein kinase
MNVYQQSLERYLNSDTLPQADYTENLPNIHFGHHIEDPENGQDYEVIRKIGGSSMKDTAIFEVEDQHENRFALKTFSEPDESYRLRVDKELATHLLLSETETPGAVPLKGLGTFEFGGKKYRHVVMELAEGTLSDLEGDPKRVIVALQSAVGAIGGMHKNGLVHRDVKPGNILVNSQGEGWLADFGVVSEDHADTEQVSQLGSLAPADEFGTRADRIVGTVGFMPPESITDGAVDAKGDVFSLAATAYQATTQKMPFNATSVESYRQSLEQTTPVNPRELNSEIPKKIAKLMLEGLSIRPQDRPNLDDVKHALLQAA